MRSFKVFAMIVLMNIGMEAPVFAEVAVIANLQNNIQLDETQVRNIFLGKVRVFSDGLPIFAIDIEPGNAVRQEFMTKVLRKSEADLNAYWTRMLFFSEGGPPQDVENSEDVIKTVAANQSAIGYIDAKLVDHSVRVLLLVK